MGLRHPVQVAMMEPPCSALLEANGPVAHTTFQSRLLSDTLSNGGLASSTKGRSARVKWQAGG
eukprot:scaffold120485_cov35-Tisochrysis_lutea.AAC.3